MALDLLALTRFKPAVGLVDDIDPAAAANNPTIAMAVFQRFEGAAYFHLKVSYPV